ncbi:tetratricopeptide repeat-containing sensor histidine kinase [Aquimarina mytili]|uniref:Sensor histidine kinase n=1 Tax=Aquimarina mytili TaxID=874423 RepID=A0A937D977_9FLAO|nr:sensor histidine kinase [Aquimarina mytili]MBL0683442.1 sensor histidine kinase [Aquimarina mytili]
MRNSFVTAILIVLCSTLLVCCKKKVISENGEAKKKYQEYIKIGKEYQYKKIDSALYFYKKALIVSKEVEDPIGIIESKNKIGWVLDFMGEPEEAYTMYKDALTLSDNIEDTIQIAKSYNSLGNYFTNLGDAQTALEYYTQSYELRLKLKDTFGQAVVAGNIGLNHYFHDEYDIAEKYMLEALDIYRELRDTTNMATCYLNLGNIYVKLKRMDDVFNAHYKALEFYKKMDDQDGVFLALSNLGSEYEIEKDYAKAIEYSNQAMKVCREINVTDRTLWAHLRFADLYNALGEYKLSLIHADSALAVNTQLNNKLNQQKLYDSKAISYESLGEYDKALEFLKKNMTMQDSLHTEDKTNKLVAAEVKLGVIKKEAAIMQLENQQLLSDRQINRLLLGLISLVGIITLVLFRMRYVSLSRKRKHAEEKEQLQRSFAQDVIQSIENERKRISRELHDSVGQSLLLIKNKIKLDDVSTDSSIIDHTIEEVRGMALALHPYQFEQQGLVKSLENLLDEFQNNSKTLYTHDIDEDLHDIDTTEGIFIYRMIQEALHNVEKHAKAEICTLRVTNQGNGVVFQIKDNGVGFNLSTGKNKLDSLGMKTLKERATLINAQLTLESIVGEGTTIKIYLDT